MSDDYDLSQSVFTSSTLQPRLGARPSTPQNSGQPRKPPTNSHAPGFDIFQSQSEFGVLNEPNFGYVSSQEETQKPRHSAQVTSPRSVYSPDASEDDSWVTPAPRVPQKQTQAAPTTPTAPSSNSMPQRQAATTAVRSPETIAPVVLGSNAQLRASPSPPAPRVSPTPIIPHLTASVAVPSRTIDLQELIKKASHEVQFYNGQAEEFRIKMEDARDKALAAGVRLAELNRVALGDEPSAYTLQQLTSNQLPTRTGMDEVDDEPVMSTTNKKRQLPTPHEELSLQTTKPKDGVKHVGSPSTPAKKPKTTDDHPSAAGPPTRSPPPPRAEPKVPPKAASPKTGRPPGPVLSNFADQSKLRLLKPFNSTMQTCHRMKPRCLIFNPRAHDILATSSLDGTIAFWKQGNARADFSGNAPVLQSVGELDRAKLRHCRFPEDMAWSPDGNRLACVFALSPEAANLNDPTRRPGKIENAQMIIINTERLPGVSAVFLPEVPHKRDPKGVLFLKSDHKLVTIGADHQVVLWDINYDEKKCDSVSVAHSMHSSEIYSVHYNKYSDTIYTGGSDRRLIGWSLEGGKSTMSIKFDERVSHIRENPRNPNILLVSFMAKSDQMLLYDLRQKQSILKLTWPIGDEKASNSQHIHPSWNPNGEFIACGGVDPVINIWDVRYSKAYSPTQVYLDRHTKRILRSEFHPHNEKVLVTMSSDKMLGWHEYEIR